MLNIYFYVSKQHNEKAVDNSPTQHHNCAPNTPLSLMIKYL